MGRKIKFDKNCGSKFITIDDEKKWELIREIATVKRYESSFNAIVNDALAFGLPELHKRLFDKVQLDGEEKAVSVPKEYSVDAFYFELIRLMKEIIANQVVEKRLICSIFNLLSLWADGTRSGENFRKGFLKDTPDFIVKDEARLLRAPLKIRRTKSRRNLFRHISQNPFA